MADLFPTAAAKLLVTLPCIARIVVVHDVSRLQGCNQVAAFAVCQLSHAGHSRHCHNCHANVRHNGFEFFNCSIFILFYHT